MPSERARQQQRLLPRPKSRAGLLAAAGLFFLLWLFFSSSSRSTTTTKAPNSRGKSYSSSSSASSSSKQPGNAPSLPAPSSQSQPDILFRCPDGRLGLHILHTRVLVSQSKSNLLFQASRLQLLRAFSVPCLRAQTSQNFVMYASYDPGLSENLLVALREAVKGVGAHLIMRGERQTAMGLTYSQLASKLKEIDPRVEKVDLYITSRIDIDDTAHVQSVAAVQEFACARPSSGKSAALSPPPVRLAYVQAGQLWFPSRRKTRPYGEVGIWKTWKDKVFDDIYMFLAIMQSMIMSGQDFIRACEALSVYGYPHYSPQVLATVKVPGCPPFEFQPDRKRTNRFMLLWDPPAGDIGNLYVRTASSWTHDKIDLHYRLEEANITTLQRSFGLSPGDLAAANLLFAGFDRGRDGATLRDNSDIPIE